MTPRDHARRVLYRTRIDALVLEYRAARTPEERFRVLRKLDRMRDLRARFEARFREYDPGETREKAIVPCI